VDALVENLFTLPGSAAGCGIGTASFIGAASIETEPDQVIRGLRLEYGGINPRFECPWVCGGERLLDRLPSDARCIEFPDIEMIAQKKSGAGAISRSRRHREADQAGAAIMKVAVLRRESMSGPV